MKENRWHTMLKEEKKNREKKIENSLWRKKKKNIVWCKWGQKKERKRKLVKSLLNLMCLVFTILSKISSGQF